MKKLISYVVFDITPSREVVTSYIYAFYLTKRPVNTTGILVQLL